MELSQINYEVHTLKLYEDIICQKSEDNGSGILYMCRTQCTKKTTEPSKEDLLSKGTQEGITFSIPKGDYLFVQGFLKADTQPFSKEGIPAEEMFDASNALFLEFLWRELEMIDDDIFVRLLLHEGDYIDKKTGEKKSAGTVFQLFRRTHL
ncbi:MAG: hypothetical protein KBT21_11855 [Treponema sp.]|nr:hypothetical protein [Candidatus Treponema merdequi]